MAKHNELGKKGEEEAVRHPCKSGYVIMEQNWIFDKNEIDIIAKNEDYIIFIEVKTRNTNRWGNPEDAVSNKKIKRIVEAADFYLNKNSIDLPARFDVISIIYDKDGFDITHIDDAFLAPIN